MTGLFTMDTLVDVDVPETTWAMATADRSLFPMAIWGAVTIPGYGDLKAFAVGPADDEGYLRVRGWKVERKSVLRPGF